MAYSGIDVVVQTEAGNAVVVGVERPFGIFAQNRGANSLIITVFGEEEQAGDSCQHALELINR